MKEINKEPSLEETCRQMADHLDWLEGSLDDLDAALDLNLALTLRGKFEEARQARDLADKIWWWLDRLADRQDQIHGLRRDIATFSAILLHLEQLRDLNPGEQGFEELLALRAELKELKARCRADVQATQRLLRDPNLPEVLERIGKRQSVH